MEDKRKIKYSIIRYTPDELRGETLNVGVILHDYKNIETKFNLLDENSAKLKALIESKVELSTYKSYKDVLEYYLSNINNNLSGTIGEKTIASFYSEEFLEELSVYYKNKKLFLSEPAFAKTKDINSFFESIFSRYVRKNTFHKNISTITAKEHLKKRFEETNLIGKKIKTDYKISPIRNLCDYKVKVDFTFKNGVWNYIQTIPKNANTNMDWYSRLQVMSQNLDAKETKILLAYSKSNLEEDETTRALITYLINEHENIEKVDTDNSLDVDSLCNYINNVGEEFDIKIG